MRILRASLPIFILALTSMANAHFIWAQFANGPKRTVQLVFADSPGDSELELITKVAPQIKLLGKGDHRWSEAGNKAIQYPSVGLNGVFAATIEYGVVNHGQGPSKLYYWIKAVSRPSLTSIVVGHGLELVAHQRADRWDVEALWNGKPCPEAEIYLGSGDAETKSKGTARIPLLATPIEIPVRASVSISRKGEFQGKPYETEKNWATLMLPKVGKAVEGADETAYLALQNASMKRDTIKLRGFACDFKASGSGSLVSGSVQVDQAGKIQIKLDQAANGSEKHVTGQVQSLFSHRIGGDFWQGEGRYPLTWSSDHKSLFVNDQLKSRYEFGKDGFRIVERTFGPEKLTLEILSTTTTPWGGQLSKTYTATKVRASDSKVTAKYRYTDDFIAFGDDLMPRKRTVVGEVDGRPISMSVEFDNYRLTP